MDFQRRCCLVSRFLGGAHQSLGFAEKDYILRRVSMSRTLLAYMNPRTEQRLPTTFADQSDSVMSFCYVRTVYVETKNVICQILCRKYREAMATCLMRRPW